MNLIVRFQNGFNKVVIELRVVQFWSEIVLVISNRTRAYDFRPNCTLLSSITIFNHDCARSRTKGKTPANQRLLKDEATKSIVRNRRKNPAASVAKSRVFVHWHVSHMFVHLHVQYVVYTLSCAIQFLEHLFEFLCMMGNF